MKPNVRLSTAIGGLQRKYQADDSTVREVVGTALQAGMGPESFEMIYKNIAYDREQQARAGGDGQPTGPRGRREAAKTRSQQLDRQRTIRQQCGWAAARGFRWNHVHPRSLRSCPQNEHGVG